MKMGKNDFDIDFDFDEEFGFDPKAFLGTEEYDTDIDLGEFSDEELGLKKESDYIREAADRRKVEAEPEEEEDAFEFSDEEEDIFEDETLEFYEESEEEDAEYEAFDPDDDVTVYAAGDSEEDSEENDMDDAGEYAEQTEYPEEDVFEDDDLEEEEVEKKRQRKERKSVTMPKINLPKIDLPKLSTPKFLISFYDLYFAPVMNKGLIEENQEQENPNRRRRRKTKAQIFKEVYLPPIIVCVCLILVMSFAIGSLSNFIAEKKLQNQLHQNEVKESEDAATLREQEYQSVMAKADQLAAEYNYAAAIDMLEAFGDATEYPDLANKKASLITTQQQLTEHREPALIPNLSFQVLIEDLARAMADTDNLKGSYNKNFVSTAEFKAILNQLYANDFVLVDFQSFTETLTDTNGNQQIRMKPIYLPAGKKPIMLTETQVNYYGYMIDSNNDGVADAKGDGFASKLVIQNGEIKAEYVDANGQTLVGDYDLVPILETFLKEHPDFAYQGARATVAVTGYEGVFGYRTNTSYIASKGQAFYDQECANAKDVVQALRNKGYNIACFTYGNVAYRDMSAAQITADLTSWTQQIAPIVGQVDTLVFARTSNISDYNSTAFNVLYNTGFRYFVSNGNQPWAEVNATYVRQNRLMVTGQNMQHYKDQFNGIFDCAAVLDVNTRGNVPN